MSPFPQPFPGEGNADRHPDSADTYGGEQQLWEIDLAPLLQITSRDYRAYMIRLEVGQERMSVDELVLRILMRLEVEAQRAALGMEEAFTPLYDLADLPITREEYFQVAEIVRERLPKRRWPRNQTE